MSNNFVNWKGLLRPYNWRVSQCPRSHKHTWFGFPNVIHLPFHPFHSSETFNGSLTEAKITNSIALQSQLWILPAFLIYYIYMTNVTLRASLGFCFVFFPHEKIGLFTLWSCFLSLTKEQIGCCFTRPVSLKGLCFF